MIPSYLLQYINKQLMMIASLNIILIILWLNVAKELIQIEDDKKEEHIHRLYVNPLYIITNFFIPLIDAKVLELE
jgi:hypothetical protein